MSSAKHARLFTFKNTVGGVTADVFTALTSQPKPRRSVPEPRLAFYSLGFGLITIRPSAFQKAMIQCLPPMQEGKWLQSLG